MVKFSHPFAEAQDTLRIAVKELIQVRLRQTDLTNQCQRRCRIPARIIGAIHYVVDAVRLDRKFHPHAMRRNRVGIHTPEVSARRSGQFGVLAVLVHAPGLVRQRPACVRHHNLEVWMSLHKTGKNQTRRCHANFDDAAKTELQRPAISFQILTEYGVGWMKEQRNAELFDPRVKRLEAFGVYPGITTDASWNIDTD